MENLIEYIISEITGSKDFKIIKSKQDSPSYSSTEKSPGNHVNYEVNASQEIIGIIIGKGGKTVRSIRNLLRVLATLEKTAVSLSVSEEE